MELTPNLSFFGVSQRFLFWKWCKDTAKHPLCSGNTPQVLQTWETDRELTCRWWRLLGDNQEVAQKHSHKIESKQDSSDYCCTCFRPNFHILPQINSYGVGQCYLFSHAEPWHIFAVHPPCPWTSSANTSWFKILGCPQLKNKQATFMWEIKSWILQKNTKYSMWQ